MPPSTWTPIIYISTCSRTGGWNRYAYPFGMYEEEGKWSNLITYIRNISGGGWWWDISIYTPIPSTEHNATKIRSNVWNDNISVCSYQELWQEQKDLNLRMSESKSDALGQLGYAPNFFNALVLPEGLEPSTYWLQISCTTNCAKEASKYWSE